VSTAYVLGDAYDKYRGQSDSALAAVEGTKALVWQSLASVLLPGFAINRVVALASSLAAKTKTTGLLGRFGPTGLGLASIPLIIKPIDCAVDAGVESFVDPLLQRFFAPNAEPKTGP